MTKDEYIDYFNPWLVDEENKHGEWRAYCPVCEDPETSKSPSSSFNFDDNVFYCNSCGLGASVPKLHNRMESTNVVDLWAKRGTGERRAKKKAQAKATDKKARPLPTAKQVQAWHDRMMGSERHHKFMNETRGLSDDTLSEFLIGFDGGKYTIPIYDEDDNLVNVRRYNPKATDHRNKMVNIIGHGKGRIYGLDVLENNDEVVLTEGELDRLVARQMGLPAVTHTSGASVFNREWAKHFVGKVVYIAYDDDESGDSGAAKVADVLKDVAHAVYRLRLKTGIRGGDITDFFVTMALGMEDWELRKSSSEVLVKPPEPHQVPKDGRRVTLEESQSNLGEPVELTVMVAGKITPPYLAPRVLLAKCDQNAGAVCNVCPLMSNNGERTVKLEPDDERMLKYIDVSDKSRHDLYRQVVGAKCSKHVTFEAEDTYTIEELVVTPGIQSEEIESPIHRQVFNVGTYRTPVNQYVRIIGQQRADPKSQRGLFQGWHLEPIHTDIDNFTLTPELREQLKVFQTRHRQDPLEKCVEIAQDMAANVTNIYGRDLLHVAYDLVFHSAISFNFAGQNIHKGWLEGLVIGDTRTGKSEAINSLVRHYQSGSVHSCESATLAGLLGGAEQASGRWMVTWGTLPLNDRRLVVLDEMSGLYTRSNGSHASKGILENLSSVRSEGKAEVTKIVKSETPARTRLIWITNPLDDRRLSDMPGSALGGLKDLVRQPEDIARFDFVLAAAGNDVESSVINTMKHDEVEHIYTSYLCHQLIMWAWGLHPDDIRWVGFAEQAVLDAAEKLGERYVPDPPLIQVENVRTKIARLAVAIAARTFSVEGTGNQLFVRRKHVNAAVRFIDRIYSEDNMGYKRHSDSIHNKRRVAESHVDDARTTIQNTAGLLQVLVEVSSRSFRPRDFEEIGAIDKTVALDVIAKLREWHMISSGQQGRLRLEPAIIRIIRELENEDYHRS